MNLYLISQSENDDYDSYESAVVAAESEDRAKMIHPRGDILTEENLNKDTWDYCWVSNIENVQVEFIGTAKDGTEEGVILASFHSG